MTEATKGFNWVDRIRKPAEKSLEDVKGAFAPGVSTKSRTVAFGRVAGTAAGLAIASGALRSKDADGNDRPALARVGDLVMGLGVSGVSVLAGHGR